MAAVFEVELTGLIRTKLPLDREQTPVYALTVTARDMGDLSGGSRLLATANVTVFLNDDNDNSPRFVSGVDDISVYEVSHTMYHWRAEQVLGSDCLLASSAEHH